jgi:hypothetical protein
MGVNEPNRKSGVPVSEYYNMKSIDSYFVERMEDYLDSVVKEEKEVDSLINIRNNVISLLLSTFIHMGLVELANKTWEVIDQIDQRVEYKKCKDCYKKIEYPLCIKKE